jgi:two-component system, cell cycle sensor histidine kinase and response regulator CckA
MLMDIDRNNDIQEQDSETIRFNDLFNLDDLQHLQDLFAEATGVASIITQPDGTPITHPSNFCRLCKDIIRNTEQGLINCMFSDSVIGKPNQDGPRMNPCLSGGLWDAGTSINVGGEHIANWLIGQVRTPDQDLETILNYADKIGVDRELFSKAFSEVQVMTTGQFSKVAEMLHAFAGEISSKAYQNNQLERQLLALRKAEEQISMLALALTSISECVCISDMNDNILYINESFLKTYGYTNEDLLGNPVSMVRSENNNSEIISGIFPKTLKGGWKGELMNKRKDGSEFPVLISTSVIHDDQGAPVALMGVASDITENKRVEASLRDSEAKFKTLFDGARDAIFIMDENYFLDCNQSTASIFGVTPNQIIGRSPSDFSPKTQPDGQLSSIKSKTYIDAALSGEPQLFEWVHTRFDGAPFYAEVGLNRIMLKGTWYLQAIVRDITKRKQAEDAIQDKANELQRFNKLMIGRELKMIELKKEINQLMVSENKPVKYIIHE